ncbi:antibiotic biosynthesis monooxygenase family protein [Ensifer adhaerens]|uniref:antibiotic biosynthesis monooxygenase family protein n=1 Tax=Ensifer adhaerens TaxID=106592 RepID=UPI003CE994B3
MIVLLSLSFVTTWGFQRWEGQGHKRDFCTPSSERLGEVCHRSDNCPRCTMDAALTQAWPRSSAGLSKRSSNCSRFAGDRKAATVLRVPLASELHRIHPVEVASHREVRMTAYNCVRFRVRPGQEERFEQLFRSAGRDFEGLRKMALSKSADGSYFSIAEWESLEAIAVARPMMKANLDTFRDTLLELSQDLGVTDPISGEAIFEMAR